MISFTPFISVIIPTYNRGEYLVNTIKDLMYQSYQNFEILVVEQSKTIDENLIKMCDSNKLTIRLLSQELPNLPKARNYGVKNATGEIILFVDDDIEIDRFF